MALQIFSKRTLLTAGLAGFVLLPILFLFAIQHPPVQKPTPVVTQEVVSVTAPAAIRPGLPLRLKIPSLGIDATIEHLGLAANGEMDTTKGPDDVAWYKPGQRPGDIGAAVIAGHFGWKNNIPAVFDNLSKLQKGDMVSVEDEKGATITFIVRQQQTYNQDSDAGSVFVSGDGKAHLNLITCEGTWSNVTKSYSNRLVVFTDKV